MPVARVALTLLLVCLASYSCIYSNKLVMRHRITRLLHVTHFLFPCSQMSQHTYSPHVMRANSYSYVKLKCTRRVTAVRDIVGRRPHGQRMEDSSLPSIWDLCKRHRGRPSLTSGAGS